MKICNEICIKKDKSTISIDKIFNNNSAKEIIKLEKLENSNIKGIANPKRLWVDAMAFTSKLCALKITPENYKDYCIMCNECTKEDSQHCLLCCSAFIKEKKRFLNYNEIKKSLRRKH